MADCFAFEVAEAVEHSKHCRTKIYAAINKGDLVARKSGRKTLILRSDLEAWLSSLPTIKPKLAA